MQRDVEVGQLCLHQAQVLEDEVILCRARAVPFELLGAVDVEADEGFPFLFGEGGGVVEGFVIVDVEILAAEPVGDCGELLVGCCFLLLLLQSFLYLVIGEVSVDFFGTLGGGGFSSGWSSGGAARLDMLENGKEDGNRLLLLRLSCGKGRWCVRDVLRAQRVAVWRWKVGDNALRSMEIHSRVLSRRKQGRRCQALMLS